MPTNINYGTSDDPGVGLIQLQQNGRFLCKIFDGESTMTFVDELKQHFKTVQIVKPLASRETSSENYVLAKHPLFRYPDKETIT